MSKQHHYIKIKPEYYRAIERGEKNFEVRFNDRDYKKYDVLHLQEWVGGEYTRREITADVSYILDDPDYCKDGFVVMGLTNIIIHN
mgnify:CR=1 FL=1